MKKTRNILVSLLACLFVILAVPAAVSAAAKAPQCPKKQTLEFYRAYTSVLTCSFLALLLPH